MSENSLSKRKKQGMDKTRLAESWQLLHVSDWHVGPHYATGSHAKFYNKKFKKKHKISIFSNSTGIQSLPPYSI